MARGPPVGDTGLHAKHWSRQQASEFFKPNAAETELDIINETDRYIETNGPGARLQTRRCVRPARKTAPSAPAQASEIKIENAAKDFKALALRATHP